MVVIYSFIYFLIFVFIRQAWMTFLVSCTLYNSCVCCVCVRTRARSQSRTLIMKQQCKHLQLIFRYKLCFVHVPHFTRVM